MEQEGKQGEGATVDASVQIRTRAQPPDVKRQTAFAALERAGREIIAGRIDLAGQAIDNALKATKWVRVGKDEWREVPDGQVQGSIGVKVLEWAIGRPRETVEVQHSAAPDGSAQLSPADMHRIATTRPDLMRAIVDDMVANLKSAEVVEIQSDVGQSDQGQLMSNQKVMPGETPNLAKSMPTTEANQERRL